MSDTLTCPTCGNSWPIDCEQTRCIQWFGSCITCRYHIHRPEGLSHDQAMDEIERIAQYGTGDYPPKAEQDILTELRDPSISGYAAKMAVLDAADEIERLRAENAELRAKVDRLAEAAWDRGEP